MYIESGAWATNLKHKLASGSPVIAVAPRFPEFFSRALQPGRHFLPVQTPAKPLSFCRRIVRLVRLCCHVLSCTDATLVPNTDTL